MLRLLFMTDSHHRADRPVARIDDVMAAQRQELEEIKHIVAHYGVNKIIHGGDLLHTAKPAYSVVSMILNWGKTVGVPIYVNIGNHDLVGYNVQGLSNVALGTLFYSGVFQQLHEPILPDNKVVIRGIPAYLNPREGNYWFGEEYKDYTKIVVSHNYVIPTESMPFDFVHPKEIDTNANIVLLGHYHIPFHYTSLSNTQFINPGALSRWAINERENKPTVLLIDIEKGQIHVTPVQLKSSRPATEIFDVMAYTEEKNREIAINEFAQSLESTEFEQEDIEKVVAESGKAQQIIESVLNLSLEKIRQAKEILK